MTLRVFHSQEKSSLGTVSKIPLEDLAADPRQLEVMESPMYRWQYVVTDLQSPRLADPGEHALHDPADLAQTAPVGRPLLRQVVLNPPLLEALVIPRRAILPVPVQGLRLAPRAAAPATDRWDVVHQVHRLQRLVAVGPGDAQGQRRALAIDE